MRSLVSALVVALLFVPALARAHQVIDVGRTATVASSFSKSVDVPPDHVVVAPDLVVTLIDIEAVLHPVHGFVPRLDETPADAPDFLESDPLRGPPSADARRW